ncbi:MAG: GntR family transcriptional regulator [Eubacteriales bacterium]|nr:GntR family transcriptional regulator [Eubacteriales bacterium]
MLEQNTIKPLYEQLMDAIRGDIDREVYKPGDRLPTETELEKIYSVSRITVRRAVKELCDRKILIKKQGKGTFVLGNGIRSRIDNEIGGFHDAAQSVEKSTTQRLIFMETVPADAKMREYLKLPAKGRVIVIKRVMCADDVPMQIDTCYVSEERFPKLRDYLVGNFSLYHVFRENYGIFLDKADRVIKVRKATAEEAGYLECKDGDPVFDIFKLVLDEKGVPVHFSISILDGKKTSYIISSDMGNMVRVKSGKKTESLVFRT